jgi:pimeloyl-ACP methyl ester carboxylesterase
MTDDHEIIDFRPDIYKSVWPEADGLRKSGRLLKYSTNITCPVVAIHGDYDPDPPEGVNVPLSQHVKDFRFVVIPKCGHKPWIERGARDAFYRVLAEEL